MPFELFRFRIGFGKNHVEHGGNSAGRGDVGEGQTVSHRVAEADFDVHSGSGAEVVEFVDHGNDESFKIRAGGVFKMTARADTVFESRFDDFLVGIERLTAGLAQFQEDMIIGTGGQNAGLLESHAFDKFKIFFHRADPRGDFGKFKSEFLTGFHGFAVLLAVEEKFALADEAVLAADPVHEFEKFDDFGNGIRRTRLLSVAERRIGNPDMFRKTRAYGFLNQFESRNPVIGKNFPEEIRLGYIFQQSFHFPPAFFRYFQFCDSLNIRRKPSFCKLRKMKSARFSPLNLKKKDKTVYSP